MYLQFVADNRTLTDLFACAPMRQVNVVADGHADMATGFVASGNYYQMLGISAPLGRTLMPDDDRPTAAPAAVISHRFWRSRFGSDSGVVGKAIQVNNVPVTIVGVLPPHVTGVQQAVGEGPDITLPLALRSQINQEPGRDSDRLSQPTTWWRQVMGRLKPGVAPEQVEANLGGVFRHTARAGLDSYLASLPESERATSANRNRTESPTSGSIPAVAAYTTPGLLKYVLSPFSVSSSGSCS